MIKHIVMFQLKPDADLKEAQAKAKTLKESVPFLDGLEVVCNAPFADGSNYDLALICDFKDMEALEAYQTHPEHVAFGAYIGQIRVARACIDYEY
ncbi:Dabb family protein [Lachnospiraceae bacterium 29-84]